MHWWNALMINFEGVFVFVTQNDIMWSFPFIIILFENIVLLTRGWCTSKRGTTEKYNNVAYAIRSSKCGCMYGYELGYADHTNEK